MTIIAHGRHCGHAQHGKSAAFIIFMPCMLCNHVLPEHLRLLGGTRPYLHDQEDRQRVCMCARVMLSFKL